MALLAVAMIIVTGASARPRAHPNGTFEMGIVAGRDPVLQPRETAQLGAKTARVEFSIDASAQEIAPVVGSYARRGVRVLLLAGFIGRIPSQAETQHLASWAAAFGPGGTFWHQHRGASAAVRDIEFGSETSYGYQFGGCGPGCAQYASRARAYALAFVTAQHAIAGQQGNSRVGLLAQADYGGGGDEWVSGMFDAVPNLGKLVAGWTVHPYGPRSWWQRSLDDLVGQTRARGASAHIPVYITELGIASDDGPCLTENYGWSRCMTYAQAGQALRSTVAEIRARYGERIRSIFLYQLADQKPPGYDDDRENYFGALRENGSPKGAFTATVRSLLHSNP